MPTRRRACRGIWWSGGSNLTSALRQKRTFLIAREIIGPDRMAEVWPAACAPEFDQAGLAHKGLERFGLAQAGAGWPPWIAENAAIIIGGEFILAECKRAGFCADEKIDKAQLP